MIQILFVCEGNVCRSPFAERLLRMRTAHAGRTGVVVQSAGTRARPGAPMVPRTEAALRAAGADADAFGARALQDVDFGGVDLVLTMERAQRATVLDLAPGLLRRTYTLLEFERLVRLALASEPITTLGQLPQRVAGVRLQGAVGSRTGEDDDVADPVAGDDADHARFRARVTPAIDLLGDLLSAVTA